MLKRCFSRPLTVPLPCKIPATAYAFPLYADPEKMRRVWGSAQSRSRPAHGPRRGCEYDPPSPRTPRGARAGSGLPTWPISKAMMQRYGTSCVYYAHASVGELHLRPAIDITKAEGVEKMKRYGRRKVALLVKKYRGSLSGEHGDGRARAPYIELVLGKEMMPLLRRSEAHLGS